MVLVRSEGRFVETRERRRGKARAAEKEAKRTVPRCQGPPTTAPADIAGTVKLLRAPPRTLSGILTDRGRGCQSGSEVSALADSHPKLVLLRLRRAKN